MGADAARRLAADGMKAMFLSSSGKGEALAEELGGFGFTGSNLETDDLKEFVQKSLEATRPIDVLINSAGHCPKCDILEILDEDCPKGIDCYLMNVIRQSRLVAPTMPAQGDRTILNNSTFAVFEPDPMFPTSSVFRAGLASLTKLFSDKFAAQNVRMNNILPGLSTVRRKRETVANAFRWAVTGDPARFPV